MIDTHAHIAPKKRIPHMGAGYALEEQSCGRYLIYTPHYTVPVPEEMFSVQEQLAQMDAQCVDTRVLSIAPFLMAPEKTGEEARVWMRRANDDLAAAVAENPERLVGFGFLHLSDAEGAREEIGRCLEDLKLRGFELPTNFGGEDLIAPAFAPIFAELNERACPILIHPTMVRMKQILKPYALGNLLGNPFETAVAAAKMLLSDFFETYPKIRILFSHGGGAFPALIGRIAHKHPAFAGEDGKITLPGNVFFDEIVFDEEMLRYLHLRFANLVFGTDAPFDMAEADPLGFAQRAVGADGVEAMARNSAAFLYSSE